MPCYTRVKLCISKSISQLGKKSHKKSLNNINTVEFIRSNPCRSDAKNGSGCVWRNEGKTEEGRRERDRVIEMVLIDLKYK